MQTGVKFFKKLFLKATKISWIAISFMLLALS